MRCEPNTVLHNPITAASSAQIRAFFNLLANRCIPRIAAAQFALIEPYFPTRRTQSLSNTPCGFSVLRCVTHENSLVEHRTILYLARLEQHKTRRFGSGFVKCDGVLAAGLFAHIGDQGIAKIGRSFAKTIKRIPGDWLRFNHQFVRLKQGAQDI